jgi:hypothetical protein
LVELKCKVLNEFLDVAEVRFPEVKLDAEMACEKAERANRALHIEIFRRC